MAPCRCLAGKTAKFRDRQGIPEEDILGGKSGSFQGEGLYGRSAFVYGVHDFQYEGWSTCAYYLRCIRVGLKYAATE